MIDADSRRRGLQGTLAGWFSLPWQSTSATLVSGAATGAIGDASVDADSNTVASGATVDVVTARLAVPP